jgi:peptide/nickel transport system permease protein
MSLLGLLISLIIAVPIGIISAVRQDSAADYVGRSTAIAFLAIPQFWLATMIVVFASVWFEAAVVGQGYEQIWEDPWANIKAMLFPFGYFIPVGPAVVLGVSLSGTVMRLTRAQMLEVMRQDYIRTAWSKGLRERTVIARHAIRNAFIPVVTLIGLQVPVLVGGSVILEQIFNVPGIGRFLLNAINQRDFPIIQGVNLVIATTIIITNLLVDLSYSLLDPRVRYS